MGIILNHSLPYSPYTYFTSLFHFDFQFIIFSKFLKVYQKWYKNGLGYKNEHLEKNHTKCLKLINIYLQYSQTDMWVLTSEHPTGTHRRHYVHCIHFMSRALDVANPSQNANNVFFFLGGAFPTTVCESPSSSGSACFVFFFSIRFCTTVRFVRSERNENIQIIREILNDKFMCHRKVYS